MRFVRVFATGLLLLAAATAEAGPRLDTIKARGSLNCGVAMDTPGLSAVDAKGGYAGFEPDLCRAIAITVFGAPRVQFKPATTAQAFLKDDSIDVVLRGLSWTFAREANSTLRFGPVYLYDGQTFLVRSDSGAKTIAALSGKTICVARETFADFLPPLQRYFAAHTLALKTIVSTARADALKMFFAGQCDAFTADATELAEAVIAQAPKPGVYNILSEEITEEPLAPLLRKGDDQFFDVVRWAIFALIDAEELGINSRNVDSLANSADPQIKTFFVASAPRFAQGWAAAIVKSIGNYGEIYARHLGAGSPASLVRGPNRLAAQGGLLYAPPMR